MGTSILCIGAVLTVSAELSTVKVKVSYYMPRRHRGESESAARRGRVVSATPWPFYPQGIAPVPVLKEPEWVSGPVWNGAENLTLTGLGTPNRTASSESLYRRCHPESQLEYNKKFCMTVLLTCSVYFEAVIYNNSVSFCFFTMHEMNA